MKKTARSPLHTRYARLLIPLVLAAQFTCALLNQSRFDLAWIALNFVGGAFITYLIIAPELLTIEDAAEERREVYRVFGRLILHKHRLAVDMA